MAQAMIRAGAEVVPATVTGSADVSAWFGHDDPMTRLIEAMVASCTAVPVLNSWFDGKGLTIRQHADVDLGIAMDTADGLFVPVIRKANALGRDDLRKQLDRLKQEVANRTIQPQDLTGATITLSNFGTLVGDHASLVIMPPQVAILGAGRVAERVVPVNGAPAIRSILPLSLSIDHRAVTGGEAARFLKAVIDTLEQAKGLKP